jgi:hypothetical protein
VTRAELDQALRDLERLDEAVASYHIASPGFDTGDSLQLDFVGFPWDPRCLDFHRTNRAIVGPLLHLTELEPRRR